MYKAARIAKANTASHPTFKVGAYLETDSYGISHGNVAHENSMLNMCAERMVLMLARGSNLLPTHLHIVTDNDEPTFPCGVCLQYMSPWPNLTVTCYAKDGTKKVSKKVSKLLPFPYKRVRM